MYIYCLLGFSCNNNCVFCATGDGNGDLETQEVIDFLSSRVQTNDIVLFSGGEPTIREDIVSLTELFTALGGKVELLSNARRFAPADAEFTKEIAKAGLKRVHASVFLWAHL